MDAIILFFFMGMTCRILKVNLKLHNSLYEGLCLYLLLAIGLKGGAELSEHPPMAMIDDVLLVLLMGVLLPLIAFPLLRGLKLSRVNAASVAAHYGSVSIGTYAVAVGFLDARGITFEGYMPLFVAILEVPAIMIGVALANGRNAGQSGWPALLHEVFFGKSVFLLLGSILVGWIAGKEGLSQLAPFFVAPFKGVLAVFLLEMGIVAASHLRELKRYGKAIVGFGLVFPMIGAVLGALVAAVLGLSTGGAVLMMTLAASASYIAAPAAMKMSVPDANPSLALVASLGVTFPFNVLVGVPLYHYIATTFL
ncbi:MAG: hypothetical protein ACI8W8_001557 [Rhodothermales bacterium]|jgi:hypothetical protein